MQDKVLNLIKEKNIVVPSILFNNYRKLKLSELDLVILIYIINNDDEFNPKKISEKINLKSEEVLNSIDHMIDLNLIKIETKKIDNRNHEFIGLGNLYEKLTFLVINEDEKIDTSIYGVFENEFGRTLAPMEYEIINSWLDSNYSEELIKEALKEAVYNGVFKLNYIDKILYEWNKKGIKTKEDISKDREFYSKKKEEKKELYDYNWLEDE